MNRKKHVRNKILRIMLALALLVCVIPAAAVTAQAAQTVEGTFTAVSMNVDGLPNYINSDGPGSEGTKKISAKMAERGWDIIGVAEDFNYNTELMSSLTGYSSGTHRGGVSSLSNDTDGLNLIWKNSIGVTGEKWVSWNTHYSSGIFGEGNGADGMIDKGYRFYQATVAEGVTVDVYILHMDADSDAGDIAARESQLTQLADAIKASDNGNPIIVMGDTNCRYTREHLETLFIDAINADERFTIQDAWIEQVRGGAYPTYGADAIVAIDKGGSYEYPEAEIVDKVFYINNTDSSVTLRANRYVIATDFTDTDGTALADHWPVVVEFTYSATEESEHIHSYTETITTEAGCETPGEKTFTCVCGDTYTEPITATGHSYTDTVTKEATCTEDGIRTYTCSNCGYSYTEPITAEGHSYAVTETKEATCTEAGSKTYTCSKCDDSYTETITATGHSYKDGTCEKCGATDDAAAGKMVLGEEAKTITSGEQYIVTFTGSTGAFSLSLNNKSVAAEAFTLNKGDPVDDVCVWTIEKQGNKYVFSTDIDGVTYYLYKTASFSGSGYKLSLVTTESKATAWSMSNDSATGSMRFYVHPGFAYYYLRYYNARLGWQAAFSAAGVHLFPVVAG